MSELVTPGRTIGIIGGGQLGRMLAIAAARLGLRTVVLEPQKSCPAAQVANHQIIASYDNPAALEELGSVCDVVTYEFENVPVAAARSLATHCAVHPNPRALEVAQDRLVEKQFLHGCQIPTADFHAVDTAEELRHALAHFGGQGVLKTRRLGYDGKGQHVFRNADDDPVQVMSELGHVPLILESFVAFEREVSVIAARHPDGEVACYDLVENIHRNGILHTSTVPARANAETQDRAREFATRLLTALDYVGIVGLELFLMADGSLIANEFAPRVHNSGHWTEAACSISQFEQHIRAVCGWPLGQADRHSDAIMTNLLGDDASDLEHLISGNSDLLHLYGKSESRTGRKMGHITRISAKSI